MPDEKDEMKTKYEKARKKLMYEHWLWRPKYRPRKASTGVKFDEHYRKHTK